MELYQLRSFVAVAELQQLTRAAESLHVSQPALSAQIKALEVEFGVELFDRTPSGMLLTAAGKQLLATAESVLTAARSLEKQARSLAGEIAGKVRIGTVLRPDFIRLGQFLQVAARDYPLLEFAIQPAVSGAACQKVSDNQFDASFYFGTLKDPELTGVKLRKLLYRVALPPSLKDAVKPGNWRALAKQRWLIGPKGTAMHELVYALLAEHNVVPKTLVENESQWGSSSLELLELDTDSLTSSAVAAGTGVGLVREDVASEDAAAGKIALWGKASIATALWFVYRKDRAEEPVIQATVSSVARSWELPQDDAP